MRQHLLVVLALLSGLVFAESQLSPKTPQIETKKESKGSIQYQQESHQTKSQPPSTPSAIPNSNDPKKNSEYGNQEGNEFWPPFLGFRFKVTDSLLVLFTAVLAIFTGKLWASTSKLVTGAEETAKKQLRAYISAVVESNRDYDGNVIPYETAIVVSNAGQTPAHKMTYWTLSDIHEFPLTKELTTPSKEDLKALEAYSVLHPGKDFYLRPDIPEFNTANRLRITNGQAVYIWGKISYEDAFGDNHDTAFCFFMDKEGYQHRQFAFYMDKNKAT